jgi:hypothetical protein
MRQHHTKVHGDPLPNRECKGCGTEFYDEKARLVFCEDCNPEAGEHNGNWKDVKETTSCVSCGTEFDFYPSDRKGLYCSDCVEKHGTFEATWFWRRTERVEGVCDYCGEEGDVLEASVDEKPRRFCSNDCLSAWVSENGGDGDYDHWYGGQGGYYGKWYSVRKQALERDDYQCQRCGKTESEMGRTPDVHHIIPVRTFDDEQDAHRLLNLVCLCRSCHNIVEANTETRSG